MTIQWRLCLVNKYSVRMSESLSPVELDELSAVTCIPIAIS